MIKILKKIGIKPLLWKIRSRIFPNDEIARTNCDLLGSYRYLEKYKYVLDEFEKRQFSEQLSSSCGNKKVWVCWLQGIENAPYIVQKCVESIKKFSSDYEVVLLDNNNIKNYISLPLYIEEKYSKGIIPNAHYTDYIRVLLLAKYGGIWIDSTFFLTDKLPDYIAESDLFLFNKEYMTKVSAANSLVAANAHNPIILQLCDLLSEYWKKENKLISYSIFHLFLTMIISHNEFNRNCWKKVPRFPSENIDVLQKELFEDFSEKRFEQIKQISTIHKLSYKFSEEFFNKENTFYKKLFFN